jgi:hypothetical protein
MEGVNFTSAIRENPNKNSNYIELTFLLDNPVFRSSIIPIVIYLINRVDLTLQIETLYPDENDDLITRPHDKNLDLHNIERQFKEMLPIVAKVELKDPRKTITNTDLKKIETDISNILKFDKN